jgi:hypothetical protein
VGRWTSSDPLGPGAFNLADPQTLDRYAYVRNSPMSLVDPAGICGEPYLYNDEGVWIWGGYVDDCAVGGIPGGPIWQNRHEAYDKGPGGSAGPGHALTAPRKPQKKQTLTCTISNGRTTAVSPAQYARLLANGRGPSAFHHRRAAWQSTPGRWVCSPAGEQTICCDDMRRKSPLPLIPLRTSRKDSLQRSPWET